MNDSSAGPTTPHNPTDLPAVLTIPPPAAEGAAPLVEKHPPVAAPVPLCIQGTSTVVAWLCGSCQRHVGDEPSATACCACTRCGRMVKDGGPNYPSHPECRVLDEKDRHAEWARKGAVRDARALLRAKTFSEADYNEPVMDGEHLVMHSSHIEDETENGGAPRRAWVFGTTKHTLHIDSEAALEQALEQDDMRHDGVAESVSRLAHEALAANIAEWNDEHGSKVVSYCEDRTQVVVLDQAGYDAAFVAALDTLALVTIVKGLCAALILINTSPEMEAFVWQRKPWLYTLSRNEEES